MTPIAPRLQRLEGLILLIASAALYQHWGQGWGMGWGLFALLFLVPDLTMLAYLAGPRIGAMAYNLGHSLLGPTILIAIGLLTSTPVATGLALIWLAQVGFDRALGYGLKSPQGFGITHLGLIGKARQQAS